MEWIPTIDGRQGPLYQRIAGCLADDIAAGRLHQGQALPTHRALAKALGIDLTTVTRAYAEARRLGLIEARVGRGTFVKAGLSPGFRTPASPGIDLSMNLPPQPVEADLDGQLAKAFADIRAESGLAPYLTYQQPGGTAAERRAAADWLALRVPGVTAERLLIAPGTQPALLSLLLALAEPGGSVITEALTYPGFKAAASALGLTLIGVEMDDEGILPKALERACRAGATKLVYLMPTMHNPTTATMPPERRAEIARILRRHDMTLIEDDPYAFLTTDVTALTALVPERSYLTASLSKCIAPGLRTSLLVAPGRAETARMQGYIRAAVQMPAPLMVAIATRWMQDGTADTLIASVRAEATARQVLARAALGGHAFAGHPNGHHVWLTLPAVWSATQFAADLHQRGLAVVTGEAFTVLEPAPNAVRIALGAARNRPQLSKALDILAEALGGAGSSALVV